eukprot:2719583-Amphidinium_carterae.1
MAVRLGWLAAEGGWISNGQWFSWDEAALRAKWDSAQAWLPVSPRTSAYRQLKLDGQSQKEERKAALNAALGGVWHEERSHSAFQVGDICVRCGED